MNTALGIGWTTLNFASLLLPFIFFLFFFAAVEKNVEDDTARRVVLLLGDAPLELKEKEAGSGNSTSRFHIPRRVTSAKVEFN